MRNQQQNAQPEGGIEDDILMRTMAIAQGFEEFKNGYDQKFDDLKAQADAIENAVAKGQMPGGYLSSGTSELSPDKFGFKNLGQLAFAVRNAARPGTAPSDGLRDYIQASATTFGSEGIGSDGGILVPPDFSREVMADAFSDDGILGRCNITTVLGNSYVQPTDESVPWGSTGIQAYWENEATALTQSKPSLKTNTQRLGKITALVPVSDELLEDAPTLSAYLDKKIKEIFSFKISLAIVQGTGAGQPLGILNAGGLKSVAKESGQAADTILFENIAKMEAAMLPQHRKNAAILAHSTCLPELRSMYLSTGSDNGVAAYMPAGGLADNPYDRLAGLPVIYTEACNPVGDVGDLILADLSQYRIIMKASGMRQDVSLHVWFDQGLTAFRFVMRISGQPWRSSVITGRDGSTTYSPFVALAERA